LATRIPKELHRRLKVHCVTHEIALQDFVVEALEERLVRWPYRTVIESTRGRWTPR
jgi:predicted HicB family RNase H-like nuclease